MNGFLIALFLIIITIITLLILYIHLYNKINESIIRIEEAESRIDNNLRDKYDLLNRSISLIRNKIDLPQDTFKEIILKPMQKHRLILFSYNLVYIYFCIFAFRIVIYALAAVVAYFIGV